MSKTKVAFIFSSTVVADVTRTFLAQEKSLCLDCPPDEADLILYDAQPTVATLKKVHTQNPNAQIICFLSPGEKLHDLSFSVKTLLKPVRLQALQEYMKNVTPQSVIRFHHFALYPGQRRLVYEDRDPITLTEKEVALLVLLDAQKGAPISREDLLKKVWGYGDGITTHTLETHIYKLKQKLKALSDEDVIVLKEAGYYLIHHQDK